MKEAALKLWTEKGWINIFPKTKAELVQLSDGRSVAEVLDFLLKNPISLAINMENGTGVGSLQQLGTYALGNNSVSFGGYAENHPSISTKAEGKNAIAAGASVQAKGYASVAVNRKTTALQYGCFAGGGGSVAGKTLQEFRDWVKSYTDKGTKVGTITSYVENDRTYCYDSSLAYEEQYYVLFNGYGNLHYNHKRFETYAIAFGEEVEAKGRASAAFNRSSHALAEHSFAANSASVSGQKAAGFNASIIKEGAYAAFAGGACTIDPLGAYAGGFGVGNYIQSYGGFAVNQGNIIQPAATNATAAGMNNICFGVAAAAFNVENRAVGKGSTASGSNTEAIANWTFTGGVSTRASTWSMSAFGYYNADTPNSVFEVGNGSASARKSALTVLADGRVKVQTQAREDNDVVTIAYLKSKGLI